MMNQEEFGYDPRGKVSGMITNIPHNVCGICGVTMIQPLPTGIWIHSGYGSEEFEEHEKHNPRFATQLEMMVIFNTQLNSHQGSDGKTTCHLHQKYWLQLLGLDLDDNELDQTIPTKLEKHDEPDWPEIHGTYDFGAYWWRSHPRRNYLKFAKYIVSRKVKYLKKNFTLEPRVHAEFYQRLRKNSSQTKHFKFTKDWEYQQIPEPGVQIKIEGEWYVVISDDRNPEMSDMKIANISIHVQPKKKAKKWMDEE